MRLSRAWKQTILPIGGAPAADSTHLVAGPPVFSSRILVQGENEISLIVVYGLYLAATIVLTWPVAARIGAHIPGWPGDPQMFVWNMWWLRFSIFDLG
ncbi:hypothetical protein FJY63_01010, partial [Candidatus Sumerlaeota bacterium]|nr:hypothetical protein [Candidatus Sumerlaeota bacterium]